MKTVAEMAQEAGMCVDLFNMGAASVVYSEGCQALCRDELERLAALVRAQALEDAVRVCGTLREQLQLLAGIRGVTPRAALVAIDECANAIRALNVTMA